MCAKALADSAEECEVCGTGVLPDEDCPVCVERIRREAFERDPLNVQRSRLVGLVKIRADGMAATRVAAQSTHVTALADSMRAAVVTHDRLLGVDVGFWYRAALKSPHDEFFSERMDENDGLFFAACAPSYPEADRKVT